MLKANGYSYHAENENLQVKQGALVIMKGNKLWSNIYHLVRSTVAGGADTATPNHSMLDTNLLWHLHLGHMSEVGMKKIHKHGLFKVVQLYKLDFCTLCIMSKRCNVKFKNSTNESSSILDYIYLDVWGPVDIMLKGGS
ncbi:unnamed protein product [Spirodela intermedia]|uniref:GAG-pre-integrase domain-containing protein n=1 Tax=Spirodela intermedia TaxID=51605 RepID=A0A7I8II71_SPIIN|nr:unnamed protein product [Spirodela intermedia]CAA6656582.1 unnamed protein product [Spirodela intermedia]